MVCFPKYLIRGDSYMVYVMVVLEELEISYFICGGGRVENFIFVIEIGLMDFGGLLVVRSNKTL